jgi:hypothetical protein
VLHWVKHTGTVALEADPVERMLHSHTIPVHCLFVKSAIVRVEYPAKTGCLPLIGAQKTLAPPGAAPVTFTQLLCKIRRESPPN